MGLEVRKKGFRSLVGHYVLHLGRFFEQQPCNICKSGDGRTGPAIGKMNENDIVVVESL